MSTERKPWSPVRRALQGRTFVFAAALALLLFLVNLAQDRRFVSASGLPQTLADLAPFALIAMATVPSVVVGGLDFSVGPVMSLTNVMFVAVLIPRGLAAPAISLPLLLGLGAVVGALSGVLISYLRIPAVIVGLCALFIVSGVAQEVLLNPESAPANWTAQLAGNWGPLPGGLVTIAVPVVVWLLLGRTALIKSIFAVGGDAPAAYASGVNVGLVRVLAYALGGMFAAVAGFALTGLVNSADSSIGVQYTLIAVAAVSLGGTPAGGGRGGLVGALLGAVSIFLIQNVLLNASVPAQWLDVVYGGVLIVAAVLGTQLVPRRRVAAL